MPRRILMFFALPAVTALVACFAYSSTVHAIQSIPYKMNFQGRLTDPLGNPMAAGTYNMKFRIYDDSSAGTLLWSEQRANSASSGVTVTTGGLFSIQLGDVSVLPASIFNNASSIYFEIELPTPATATCTGSSCEAYTEGAMTPRNKLGSSAYAFNSDTLDGMDSSAFAPASGSSNYAPASGSANYIQNGTSQQASSSFNISGNGTIGGAGTVSGNFTNNGVALFSNTVNSTSAFAIQGTSSTKLFVADTTNSRIYVGNPAGDTATVLFVVDNSSQAADPTGVAGAMYYNTSMAAFRCFENGVWYNCIGNNTDRSRQSPVYSADFLGSAVTAAASPNWLGVAIGSGTSAFVAANSTGSTNHPGQVLIKSSATGNSGYKYQTDVAQFILGGGEVFELVFRTDASLTNTTIQTGFIDATTSAESVDGAYILVSGTTLSGKTATNSSRSTTASTYTLSTSTWYRLKVVVTSTSRVDYYLYNESGTQLWTDNVTANIPTVVSRETGSGVVATNSGTTAVNLCKLDYMAVSNNTRLIR